MTAQLAPANSTEPEANYPFAGSKAQVLLADALHRASREKNYSQRTISAMLGYRSSVGLSHMAMGRVPIPIDRAMDFARMLGIDPAEILMAALEQRHPEIDFRRIFGPVGGKPGKAGGKEGSIVKEDLEALAGKPLDELPQSVVDVLRDAVSDRQADRRWMKLSELPVINAIRQRHPHGLSAKQRTELTNFINQL